ncbi:hypothetical protein TREMEDRAFT_60951 [Tremella mesenterica DSM 1558]|uniref:uncharacterized protein n=1 Tax=Tremella mesenterica (strain ATCC 24925 / CBS 8224 / DSM 1558 / NBRC 9311 / NRRL Y-6157 / RJB 2259-6 / UBC 559-6) TaxID=578456 RepID=UPI0003F4A4E8|nr:uncharacterized protein TREMEDRAFT_60951 [Tremella mesenterica DSM 1558]EIW70447.1 hypothetical protein TREMEDRAFT_60951 [Tremella mesenterica DSM 1558]
MAEDSGKLDEEERDVLLCHFGDWADNVRPNNNNNQDVVQELHVQEPAVIAAGAVVQDLHAIDPALLLAGDQVYAACSNCVLARKGDTCTSDSPGMRCNMYVIGKGGCNFRRRLLRQGM